MNGSENYLAIAIIAFISGALFGALVYRIFKGDGGKSQRVEQKMDALQEKHTQYQAQVNDHFLKTAHLINRLNEDYREVNAHLAQSASMLCSEENTNQFIPLNQDDSTTAPLEGAAIQEPESADPSDEHNEESTEKDSDGLENTSDKESVEPPRDYAPKKDADKGTLTEGFGLKDKEQKE